MRSVRFLPLLLLLIQCVLEATMHEIEVLRTPASVKEFVNLRAACGMRPRTIASAEKGLRNTLFWVTLRKDNQLIGMGRVVGDGGTVVQITDIAVHPEHRKKGYGRYIFEAIQEYILNEIPDDAFVCLFAEKEIAPFYHRNGFEYAHEKWPGMFWPCKTRVNLHSTPLEYKE